MTLPSLSSQMTKESETHTTRPLFVFFDIMGKQTEISSKQKKDFNKYISDVLYLTESDKEEEAVEQIFYK